MYGRPSSKSGGVIRVMPLERTVEVPASPPSVSLRALMAKRRFVAGHRLEDSRGCSLPLPPQSMLRGSSGIFIAAAP